MKRNPVIELMRFIFAMIIAMYHLQFAENGEVHHIFAGGGI